ncbi:ribosomal-protein-serine acetyltransferase [Thermoactinomyces sp. DSM 45891]|uniref:GNAT family N-acetyltransferase n=1 Tax=Thermoactinomyces sp. DSM 45891 TaxID=1761907 RepID=UPI0009172F25|nr:GNAT family protein [Thermoactinomyces sp. DSM 45891]SFX70812.1 ribosomal-protein-serine acetyltransferase [Thermoactinomyces sp. DSM 45891]
MFHRKVSEDITLKQLETYEEEILFRLVDQNRFHLRNWVPWVDGTKSIEDTRSFLTFCENQFKRAQLINAGIWYKDDLVGCIGFNEVNLNHRYGKIGYWLSEDMQGKGIVRRACTQMVRYGFQEMDLNRIEIRVATGNKRSQAIPRSLGFVQEGLIRQTEWLYDHYVDHLVFGLLKEEYEEKMSKYGNETNSRF